MEVERRLPVWVTMVCGVTTLSSILISLLGIFLHLKNYRKPFEQRLIVRILVLVPLFSISCYCMLMSYKLGRLIEPIREIYEAFTIYTFFKLLVLMLGGERRIILMTVDQQPTSHPFPTSLFLKKVNISHPQHFLTIKRCILQYVWVKPLLYIIIFITSLLGIYDVNDVSMTSIFVWIGVCYNISVTVSLYSLAMFWKCLYNQLNAFNPWRKFLCVKLIIFASYWQGLIVGMLTWLGVFNENTGVGDGNLSILEQAGNLGIQIQNGLLCFEMIFFALLHWNSFPYTDFTVDKFPDAARMNTWVALKDFINIGDLIYDLKITTMYGDSYNLRNFDALTDSRIYNSSDTFNQKIYHGLRISADGKKYWINIDENEGSGRNIDGYDNIVANNFNNSSHISHDNSLNDSSVRSIRSFTDSIRGKHSKKGIVQTENIENQAKVLFGGASGSIGSSSNDKRISKSPQVNSTTPLLSEHANNNPNIERGGYVNNINVLIGDSNSVGFEEGNFTRDSEENLVEEEEPSFNDDLMKDERLYRYVKSHYVSEQAINYPVEYEYNHFDYSTRINRLRERVRSGNGSRVEV